MQSAPGHWYLPDPAQVVAAAAVALLTDHLGNHLLEFVGPGLVWLQTKELPERNDAPPATRTPQTTPSNLHQPNTGPKLTSDEVLVVVMRPLAARLYARRTFAANQVATQLLIHQTKYESRQPGKPLAIRQLPDS
jgi:hypothetical protein